MSAFHVYHSYADLDQFRAYLAGSNYSSGWSADEATLLNLLEHASRMIDDYVGSDGTFGPTVETRLYDLGSGDLRYDPRSYERAVGIATSEYRTSVVPLDRWLISATTVTAYADSARTTSQTLTAGLANDYILEPYNNIPKYRLKLTENTTKALGSGQQVLSIAGTWGWEDLSHSNGTLDGAINSTTATSVVVSIAGTLAVGVTIKVDDEQMYITALTPNNKTLTVIRGVNGTTAATHLTATTIYHIEYPNDVRVACMEIARVHYRERDMGIVESIGTTEQSVTSKGAREIADSLSMLNHYQTWRHAGGLVF